MLTMSEGKGKQKSKGKGKGEPGASDHGLEIASFLLSTAPVSHKPATL